MDSNATEPARQSASAEPKAVWTAPQVDELIAGGAEGNAGLNVEGLDGLS